MFEFYLIKITKSLLAYLAMVSLGLLSTNIFAAGVSVKQLTAERNARINAETILATNFAAEKNARLAADASEATARQQAVQNVQSQINAIALPPLPAGQFQVSLTRCGNSNALQWEPCRYQIGDTGPAGGIVFYLSDSTGHHGLEAAPVDQTSAAWGCLTTSIAGAAGAAVGIGAANTAAIVVGCGEPGTAAKIAGAYSLNGYDDWYLPSKDELHILFQQRAFVGGFVFGVYWSSTESPSGTAWSQSFVADVQAFTSKADPRLNVRAVRTF